MKKLVVVLIGLLMISGVLAIANPAAVYCGKQGYEFDIRIRNDSGAQYGVCVFPDGSECGSWDFITGKCGPKWTLCEREGGKITIVSDGQDTYTPTYAVCNINGQTCKERIFVETKQCGSYSAGTNQDQEIENELEAKNETEDGQDQETATEQDTQNKGEESQIKTEQQEQVQTPEREQSKDVEKLKQMIQQRKQEMEQELIGLENKQGKVYQNQNTVRLAVHALLAMENLSGGIGKQVSEIARGFNNSVQSTINAEEKIERRGGIARFFTGGDSDAAEEIEQEVVKNQEKIKELKQLKEQCECDDEVKAVMQEQIQNMGLEQARLKELAEGERKSKGLFGWLWK